MQIQGFRFDSEREMAAFLGNIAQETWHLSIISEECAHESGPSNCLTRYDICDWWRGSETLSPPSKYAHYYGRGPLQISYPCNYLLFDEYSGRNTYQFPDSVASNLTIAWESAVWVWTLKDTSAGYPWNRSCADYLKNGEFGHCIRRINGIRECDGNAPKSGRGNTMMKRTEYYQDIRQRCFGLFPEQDVDKLYC